VVDGAAFRCTDGSLLHVSLYQGNANDATCKLTELHPPGLQMGKPAPRGHRSARQGLRGRWNCLRRGQLAHLCAADPSCGLGLGWIVGWHDTA
jgi:hypothetical protein